MESNEPLLWNTALALGFCHQLEQICPQYGCHVALTGGCLYGMGKRKDIDIVLYRIRQCADIDYPSLWEHFEKMGITLIKDHGFVAKCKYNGYNIDFLFPEREGKYKDEENTEIFDKRPE